MTQVRTKIDVEAAITTVIVIVNAKAMNQPMSAAVIDVKIAATEIATAVAMLVVVVAEKAADPEKKKAETEIVMVNLVRTSVGIQDRGRKCDVEIVASATTGHPSLVRLTRAPTPMRTRVEIGHLRLWALLLHRRRLLILHPCPTRRMDADGILVETGIIDPRTEIVNEKGVVIEAAIVTTNAMETIVLVIAREDLPIKKTMRVEKEARVDIAWEETTNGPAEGSE